MTCFLPSLSLSSSARSDLSEFLPLTNDHIFPQLPATNRRLVPGAYVKSSGSSNFGSFGNATSVLYGGGGSGEPMTFDVVHGTRFSRPYFARTGCLSCSAAVVNGSEMKAQARANTRERCMVKNSDYGEYRFGYQTWFRVEKQTFFGEPSPVRG